MLANYLNFWLFNEKIKSVIFSQLIILPRLGLLAFIRNKYYRSSPIKDYRVFTNN